MRRAWPRGRGGVTTQPPPKPFRNDILLLDRHRHPSSFEQQQPAVGLLPVSDDGIRIHAYMARPLAAVVPIRIDFTSPLGAEHSHPAKALLALLPAFAINLPDDQFQFRCPFYNKGGAINEPCTRVHHRGRRGRRSNFVQR